MNGNTSKVTQATSRFHYLLFFHYRSITVRRGRTIKFEFLHFDIPPFASSDCRNYVILKNGASMESPFLGQGKYCGTVIPTVEKTSSNHALVGEEII